MNQRFISSKQVDRLRVMVFDSRQDMGDCAGRDVAEAVARVIDQKGHARMVLAAAPSQNELLAYLSGCRDVDWTKVTAFHMDEYIGLPEDAPQRFANFLDRAFFEKVPLVAVHRMHFAGDDIGRQIEEYGRLLTEEPIDVVCMGVGENGHIAFNDPGVAAFHDPLAIKIVDLDQTCRMQQVNDGCFRAIGEVPQKAVTLTIPTILSGARLFCIVPGATKARAVRAMLTGPIEDSCPASILREHPDCTLYLDRDSNALALL